MGLFNKRQKHHEDFGGYATAGLMRSLSASSVELLSGSQLAATDGIIYEYRHDNVDWESIWRAAALTRNGVPPFGIRTYWHQYRLDEGPVPISVVALFGTSARLRVALDPLTPETLLVIMAENNGGDPDSDVRAAAARRIDHGHY